MATSKALKDPLALGDYLVRELGFADGVDTLGRWMSHHVAERIAQARKGGKNKGKAEREARAAILKLWAYRRVLPGNAYPLAKYDKVIEFLELLRPSDSPFGYFKRHRESENDSAAAELFDSFSRLLATLLLLKVANGPTQRRRQSAQRALSPEERDLVASLNRLFRLATPPRQRRPQVRVVLAQDETTSAKAAEAKREAKAIEPTVVAIAWLDRIAEQVLVLKRHLMELEAEPLPRA